MDIGAKIQDILDDTDMTQKTLAQKLGIPLTTLNGYMKGRREFPLDILRDIADALNVTTDFLLGASSHAERPILLQRGEEKLILAYRTLHSDQKELIAQNIRLMQEQNQR